MKRRLSYGVVVMLAVWAAASWAQGVTDPGNGVPCVVAAPRACLAIAPVTVLTNTGATVWPPPVIGAAFNFAPTGVVTVVMPTNRVLITKFAPESEAVWYPRTAGLIGSSLILDLWVTDSTTSRWVTVGRNAASQIRVGPAIGRMGQVAVSFRPPRPGLHLLRARVYTFASPQAPTNTVPDPGAITVRGASAASETIIRLYVTTSSVTPLTAGGVGPVPEMPYVDVTGTLR